MRRLVKTLLKIFGFIGLILALALILGVFGPAVLIIELGNYWVFIPYFAGLALFYALLPKRRSFMSYEVERLIWIMSDGGKNPVHIVVNFTPVKKEDKKEAV